MTDIITLYEEEGNGFIKIRFDETLQVWLMHLDCKAWSKSDFIRYKKVFKMVCADLKAQGMTEFYGLASSKKAVKFNKLFGAYPTGDVILTEDGLVNQLIKMEI